MAEFPALPLWTDSYLADTLDMNEAQHGCYLIMLMICWRRESCSLPNDMDWLHRAVASACAGMHRNRFNALVPPILNRFFTQGPGGEWHQKRLGKEREFLRKRSAKQRDLANKRWAQHSQANALDNAKAVPAGIAPTPTPTPTPIKKEQDGAGAPGKDPLWTTCLNYIAGVTKDEEGARRMIGKWRSDYGPEAAMEAIFAAKEANASGPIAYVNKCLSKKLKRNGGFVPYKVGGG